MQRYVKLLIILLLISTLSWGALVSTTVWEVRPTVGTDTNGGGFDSAAAGTDMSQFNNKNATSCTSCQSATANLSETNAVAVGTTTITSATANFTSAITGNIINLSGGTGTLASGWYEATFVSSTSITVDRSVAAGTGLTMNIGGALATVAQANTNWVASNQVFVKATGTYTVTTTLTITLDSHAAPGIPAAIIGYTSTRGDGGQFTWTTATNSVSLITFQAANNVSIQNVNFTTTAGTVGNGFTTTASGGNTIALTVINCKFSGFNIGINGNFTLVFEFEGLFFLNSRITGSVSHGIINGGATYLLGSMLDNNGGDGFNTGTSESPQGPYYVFENSILYKNAANGINVTFSNTGGATLPILLISHCDISTNTGAGYVSSNAVNPLLQASNSIFDANGTYGVDTGSTSTIVSALLYDNAFFNNTTAPTRGVNAGIGTITLTASPYTVLGSNFALNSTSGGGAALKNAGFPGTIPNGGTGFASVGALQPTVSSGGGQKAFAIIQ